MQGNTTPFTDDNVRKAVWEGGVPIVFTLHQNDLTTFEPPLPYYVSSRPLILSLFLFSL